MPEQCPLSRSSGFYYQENIPEVCLEQCEPLWNQAIINGQSDHEEYPDYILADPNCAHPLTEHGSSSLQSTQAGSVRAYGLTERCTRCNDEIAEDSYVFECPNS